MTGHVFGQRFVVIGRRSFRRHVFGIQSERRRLMMGVVLVQMALSFGRGAQRFGQYRRRMIAAPRQLYHHRRSSR